MNLSFKTMNGIFTLRSAALVINDNHILFLKNIIGFDTLDTLFNLAEDFVIEEYNDTVEFNNNKMIGSSFNYIEKFKNMKFLSNDLKESEFIKTNMKDIDLSDSFIDGISVSSEYLKGLTINMYQAIEFTKILGINIK